MNIIKSIYITFTFLVLLSGCASTTVSSFVDPEYATEKYSRPIVWGKIAPLEDRQRLENGIVKNFRNKGVNAIPGTQVFPPTRDITKEFIASALVKSGGDSLFIVSLKTGSNLYHMEYEATLYGNKIHKVWVGSVVTELQQAGVSNSQSNDVVFESTAEEIVNKIITDGVIQ